jgi:hypothetical protein
LSEIILLKRHLVKRTIFGDTGIVDEHIDRAEVGLDILDARRAGVERTHVPFIDGNAGLGLELVRRSVVAGITGGDLVACGLQRLADRRANAPRSPPVTNATRAMSNSSLVGIIPVFDSVFQMKMPGARPGIPILSA